MEDTIDSGRPTQAAASIRPYLMEHDRGEVRWFFGGRSVTRASTTSTGGSFALLEQTLPAGSHTPWHVHRSADESFYVLGGRMSFVVGEERRRIVAGAGDFVFGPRRIPHGFRVDGDDPLRLLIFAVPSGFDEFVFLASEAATHEGFSQDPPDLPRMMAAAARYNIEILGPLPD